MKTHMAHKIDAGHALNDSVVRNTIFAQQTWPDPESLCCALVIGDLVTEMLEIIVAH
jgi:hypothetical protein